MPSLADDEEWRSRYSGRMGGREEEEEAAGDGKETDVLRDGVLAAVEVLVTGGRSISRRKMMKMVVKGLLVLAQICFLEGSKCFLLFILVLKLF